MITGLTYAIVTTDDVPRARRFFTEQLGLTLDHIEPYGEELEIAFLPCGETLVELIEPRTQAGSNADYLKENGPGIQHVAFEVDDLEAALAELAERGVEMVTEPHDEPFGRTFAFRDPDGRVLHAWAPRGR